MRPAFYPQITAVVLGGSFCSAGMCQNLLYNASFEFYNGTCDAGVSFLDLDGWQLVDCAGAYWYFHACNNSVSPFGGTPANFAGHEQPYSGDAYLALIPYTDSDLHPDGNPKSYAVLDFAAPLTAGQEYCIRIQASLVDSSSYTVSELFAFVWYGIPSVCNYQDTAWDTNAAVTFDLTNVDTSGWTLLEGSFVAFGGETSLTIGSFLFGPEIDTTFIMDQPGFPLAAYYVDDVYLGPCDVSVDETITKCSLEVFPNPVLQGESAWLSLECEASASRWTIIDPQGRIVLSGTSGTSSSRIKIPTSGLNVGTYALIVRNEHGLGSTGKLLVR